MWQDIFFASNGIVFAVMLIPQIIDAYRGKGINLVTASLTTALLFFQCYAYATMGMYFAAIPFTAAAWALLLYYSYKKRLPSEAYDEEREIKRRLEERMRFWQSQISTTSHPTPFVYTPKTIEVHIESIEDLEPVPEDEHDIENNSDLPSAFAPAFTTIPVSKILDYLKGG